MIKPALVISSLFSWLIVICTLALVYVEFAPINVLKNWTLSVPGGTYHQGQEVAAHVEVDKVRNSQAYAHRNIECLSKGNFISYHLVDVQGGKRAGHISSNIVFKIPSTIPDLPTTCRFSIASTYKVYGLRSVNDYVASNTFRLEP